VFLYTARCESTRRLHQFSSSSKTICPSAVKTSVTSKNHVYGLCPPPNVSENTFRKLDQFTS
jgi:hypothetical protein